VPGVVALSADILSASGRSTLRTYEENPFERLFALRAQADRMSAPHRHCSIPAESEPGWNVSELPPRLIKVNLSRSWRT
jgi:hypothetical protein